VGAGGATRKSAGFKVGVRATQEKSGESQVEVRWEQLEVRRASRESRGSREGVRR
jgi:hypothetical protein